MYRDLKIKPPFFEIGPKAYLYGDEMLRLAKEIDRIAVKYDVDIIVTPQYTDIRLLAENTERILVFAAAYGLSPIGRGGLRSAGGGQSGRREGRHAEPCGKTAGP